jgi:molybdopterin-containing oxidoreductase family iron-sulfur binding subunit
MNGRSFDLDRLRQRLAQCGEARLWSSIEELLDENAFRSWVEAEFPAAAALLEGPRRREFLKLMGASLMLAGLAGCKEDRSNIALPYVTQPEQEIPGVPRFYATAVSFEGYAQPVLARTNSGRPTKLDGNPEHPATRGGSDPFIQTAVLQLYDPERSQAPMRKGEAATWARFERDLVMLRQNWTARQGEGLRVLTGSLTSPTVLRQLREWLPTLPKARLHVFEPVGAGRRTEAMLAAFGRDLDVHYALEKCQAIVSLDEDLVGPGPRQVMHARSWAQRRGEVEPQQRCRLHIAESVPSLSGVMATTRLPIDTSRMSALAAGLADKLGLESVQQPQLMEPEAAWVETAARDLQSHAGRSLLACGAHLRPDIQAFAAFVNERLGNVGTTLSYSEPIALAAGQNGTLADLARDMAAGLVDTLIVLDCNPVYAGPGSLEFASLLARNPNSIHAGLYHDETAAACTWHLPLAHPLESWGDARAIDGTATIIQPVIAPLYSVRTVPQVLAMLAGAIDPAAEPLVRATWVEAFGDAFETRWKQALYAGFVTESAARPVSVTTRQPQISLPAAGTNDAVEVVFRPDPCVWDGRFASVAWLQELPKPLTKITWDAPVSISPRLAHGLSLANGDLVEVSIAERRIVGPAWIMPGQAPNTVALFLGYGRQSGQIAKDLGYSAYALRPLDDPWSATGKIRRVKGSHPFATTQLHHRMDGFDFVKEVSAEHPTLRTSNAEPSLYPEWKSSDYAWGMAIDLDRCIGCNACVAACNVENNVLVVGKEQVEIGREMLWLRVDRYYTGDVENPQSYFQPVPCMHCEKAPCEMGCPVNATVHNSEGINQQVYNRCIGTRTCSSYCPYKVRRFNWYDYRPRDEQSMAARNPDVTVRSRGVMEKCTYCTQRVQAAHVAADKEGRKIRAGEVVTACQQACPTTAITFGNLKNSEEEVAKLRQSGRHYVLLEELGTRPRTTYLARWKDV